LEILYQKNSLYREIHVDGALGGVTPRGKININFYAERLVIPRSETYNFEPGRLGDRIGVSADSKKGVMREIEFGIYVDLDTAKQLHKWLENKIISLEEKPKKGKK
jgi:hypothetical protein